MKLNLQLFAEDAEAYDFDGYEDFEESFDYTEDEPEEDYGDYGDDYDEPQQPWKNEHNAEMAAQRRRAELENAIQAARMDAKNEVYREMFKGQINPYTGGAITSEADYKEYQQQVQNEQLQEAGVDPNIINEMVMNHPALQQAQQILQQQQEIRGNQLLNDSIKRIGQLDPDIRSFQDLYNSASFPEIDQLVHQGYSLENAYKVVNFDKITQRRQAAAKQQALNSMTSKAHLQATASGGAGEDISVPEDVMNYYKQMLPDATDAEIRKSWAKYTKG